MTKQTPLASITDLWRQCSHDASLGDETLTPGAGAHTPAAPALAADLNFRANCVAVGWANLIERFESSLNCNVAARQIVDDFGILGSTAELGISVNDDDDDE